jgi:hypothetical protein
MNFHVKLATGYAAGVKPSVKLADGWHEGRELFVKTADGWRTVWRRTVTFINTVERAGVSIFQLMGSPTKAANYVFINRAAIYGGSSGFALRTGVFPAGSTLKIINESAIRGRGGDGGGNGGNSVGSPGGSALWLDFSTLLDNAAGYIFGGGGGASLSYASNRIAGGGGGAGRPAGNAGGSFQADGGQYVAPGAATETAGGAGAYFVGTGPWGVAGGAPGSPGSSSSYAGGAAGNAVTKQGQVLTWLSGNTTDRVKGPIV